MCSVQNVIQYLFIWIFFTFGDIYSQAVGDSCINQHIKNNPEGVCTLVIHCEDAIRLIKSTNNHTFFRCGFNGSTEIVCCPETTLPKYDPTTDTVTRKVPKRRADEECDKLQRSEPLDTHIINGVSASLGEFPHMVAIGYWVNDELDFKCGGSLISETFVLTAAHCSKTRENEPFVIRGGTIDIGNNKWNKETDFLIEEIIVYPNYTTKLRYDDIALLRLQNAVTFSKTFNAACLYTDVNDPRTTLTVTGWGVTNFTTNAKSSFLQKVDLPIVSREKCRKTFEDNRKLPSGVISSQLCVGDLSGERDSCHGDSGGPLQSLTDPDLKYRIVGITSFGIGCATKSKPAIYTRVSAYVDWIENVVWPN